MPIYDYTTAQHALETARNGNRKVANNTRLEQFGADIQVVLHGTPVVTYHPDGSVTLKSGGWETVTTKQRINAFQNIVWLWQTHREWFVHTRDNSIITNFVDGMRVYPDGRIA